MENKIPGVKYPATKFSTFCFEWLESLVQAIVVIVILLTFVFRVVNVDGRSMENTLHDRDKLIISKWNYVPQNGDVIVITRGEIFEKPIVKRIIATAGQTFSMTYGEEFKNGCEIKVNSKVLDEPYIKETMYVEGDMDLPSVVPEGKAIVMGDNRNHSADSRTSAIGLIPYEHIVGKAQWIILPTNRFGAIK